MMWDGRERRASRGYERALETGFAVMLIAFLVLLATATIFDLEPVAAIFIGALTTAWMICVERARAWKAKRRGEIDAAFVVPVALSCILVAALAERASRGTEVVTEAPSWSIVSRGYVWDPPLAAADRHVALLRATEEE
jgi:hypothetical protein